MKRMLCLLFTRGLKITILSHLGLIFCSFLLIEGIKELGDFNWHWSYIALSSIILGTAILLVMIAQEVKSRSDRKE
jgi:hypothetical protein